MELKKIKAQIEIEVKKGVKSMETSLLINMKAM